MFHNPKLKRFLAFVLVLILGFGALMWDIGAQPSAQAVTQAQIDALKDDQADLKQKIKDVQAKIDSLEYEQLSTLAKKEVLDEKMNLTQAQIDNVTIQISEYEMLIVDKEAEVVAAQDREDEQWDTYKIRIRAMEENGTVSYVESLFSATSFADLLTRLDTVSEIMAADNEMYKVLDAARLSTIRAKEDLESAKGQMEDSKVQLEDLNRELEAQILEAGELLAQIEENLEEYQATYDELEEQENKLQKQINEMVAELERQQAANNSGGKVSATGSFIWPSAASRIVTSQFGTRFHPVHKVYKTHNGIDIGAGYGTNVLAADGGTVITAKYSSSYGNYIVIYHGNNTTTLYAHMSKLLVSKGDTVKQGEVIGKVGSTGVVTGPHLHFEVSINGSRVNPLQYFSNYELRD